MTRIAAFVRNRYFALGAGTTTVLSLAACSAPPCGYGPAKCF